MTLLAYALSISAAATLFLVALSYIAAAPKQKLTGKD